MTITKKQHLNDNYYISMNYENNLIKVQVCPKIDENLYGYPIREMIYHTNEEKQANNTFNRYIKKYI